MHPDRGLLLFKSETTPGVDAVPTAALNAIAVDTDMKVFAADPKFLQRNILRESLSKPKDVVAGTVMGLRFTFELKGAGGAVDAIPRWDPVLQAAGLGRTVNATVSVQWDPVNNSFTPGSAYAYFDGILSKILFCHVKSLAVREARAEYCKATAEMIGLYQAPVDGAIAAGAVFDPSQPVEIANIGLALGAHTPVAEMFEFTINTNLGTRTDLNSVDGIKGITLGRRDVTGRIDPEATTEAIHPWWANFRAGTSVAVGGNTIGTVAGNKVQITMPAVQYDGPDLGRRGEMRTYGMGLRIRASTDTASDEIRFISK